MSQPIPTRWLMAWLLVTGILIVLYPPFALAIGDDVALGSFSCTGGVANGQLSMASGTCPTTLSFDNVFSFLVCSMQQLAGNLLGHMYCGMIHNLAPAVWAAITLATLIFGIAFTFGIVAATGREATVFLLKLAFVAAFATEADFMIGIAYQLLISGMSDGVAIVLNGMGVTKATTGGEAFSLLDGIFKNILDFAIGGSGAEQGEARCKNALFAVLATIGMAFPLVAYFCLMLIGRILFSLFRAIFGYIYAIFGVTFLIILSPFFVSFYLFKPTQALFNKWLGYMVSMVVQVVILFAFLIFILSLPISNLTSNLTNIIMYQEESAETTAFRLPWQYCTICDFQVVARDNPSLVITDSDPHYIETGMLQCKTPKEPITLTFALAPQKGTGQMGALLTFLGNGILSLIVLAFLVERLLSLIPLLAQRLGGGLGANYAPQMGGGDGVVVVPGERLAANFKGGFEQGMKDRSNMSTNIKGREVNIVGGRVQAPSGDGISSAFGAIGDGIETMVTGKYTKFGSRTGAPDTASVARRAAAGMSLGAIAAGEADGKPSSAAPEEKTSEQKKSSVMKSLGGTAKSINDIASLNPELDPSDLQHILEDLEREGQITKSKDGTKFSLRDK